MTRTQYATSNNFGHGLQTQHETNKLMLRDLTRLIK